MSLFIVRHQHAVSTAEWTGVPLVEILDRAGVRQNAKEVLFRGADGGAVDGRSEPMRFERSLQIDEARDIRCVSSFRAGTRWRRSSG